MKQESLIGYALSFASFVLDSKIGKNINRIILFGSVARGDFTEESDIDVFVDTEKDIEIEAEKLLILFRSSRTHESWKLRGLKNQISLKIGNLKKWSLRREVISSGILLYGKYNDVPDGVKYYLMIKMDLRRIKQAKQMRIWRKLYGYKQKIGKKIYTNNGLVESLGGEKLGKAIIIVPMETRLEILELLKKHKIKHTVYELWSDSF